MPVETPSRVDYKAQWSTPHEKGKSSWLFDQNPDKIGEMIDTMDLSRLAFKGQEHGIVQRINHQKILGIFNKQVTTDEDTGKIAPTGQPWSVWTFSERRNQFTHAWQNEDPFYGYGNSAGTDTLSAIANGEMNVSNLTEKEFRADLKLRFRSHYAAKKACLKAYVPYIQELKNSKTKEALEAIDKKIKDLDMSPESGMANAWTVAHWAEKEEDFQEEAQRRIALIADKYLPYTFSQLSSGLQTFGEAGLEISDAELLREVDIVRGKSDSTHSARNPFIIFRRGTGDENDLKQALDADIGFLSASIREVSWDKNTLHKIGALTGLLESIEGALNFRGKDLLNHFPDYRKIIEDAKKTILDRSEK